MPDFYLFVITYDANPMTPDIVRITESQKALLDNLWDYLNHGGNRTYGLIGESFNDFTDLTHTETDSNNPKACEGNAVPSNKKYLLEIFDKDTKIASFRINEGQKELVDILFDRDYIEGDFGYLVYGESFTDISDIT